MEKMSFQNSVLEWVEIGVWIPLEILDVGVFEFSSGDDVPVQMCRGLL